MRSRKEAEVQELCVLCVPLSIKQLYTVIKWSTMVHIDSLPKVDYYSCYFLYSRQVLSYKI